MTKAPQKVKKKKKSFHEKQNPKESVYTKATCLAVYFKLFTTVEVTWGCFGDEILPANLQQS